MQSDFILPTLSSGTKAFQFSCPHKNANHGAGCLICSD